MIKKIKTILLIILAIQILLISKVCAYTFGVPYVGTGQISSSSSGPASKYKEGKKENFKVTDDYAYSCSFEYYVGVSRKITINIFDAKGNLLNENSLMPSENIKFPAGTAIGLDIYEDSWVSWEIKNIKVTKSGYECRSIPQRRNKHFYSTTMCTDDDENSVWYISEWYNQSGDSTYDIVSDSSNCRYGNSDSPPTNGVCETATWNTANNKIRRQHRTHYYINPILNISTTEYENECRQIAFEKVQSEINNRKYSSYKVDYYDPNDITNKNTVATIKCNSSDCISCPNIYTPKNQINPNKPYIIVDKLKADNLDFCKFDYNLKNTCINRVTGEITYNKNCDQQQELLVTPTGNGENGPKTLYFSPLETKGTDEFRLLLNTWQANQTLTKDQCDYIKEHNPKSWDRLIVGPDDEILDESNYNSIVKEHSDGKTACRIKTGIIFPLVQKFYNEDNNQSYASLKGYGMYFRQIDINNPFPSGIENSIYWKDLYRQDGSVKVKINNNDKLIAAKLEKGFDKPTYISYITTSHAINTIKNYNNHTSYTSWGNQSADIGDINKMYWDGHSGFITNNQDIIKRMSTTKYYKLGCGPLNSNWVGCGNP